MNVLLGFLLFSALIPNVDAADFEVLTLKGKWKNSFCEYRGSLLTETFPAYAIYFVEDSAGRRKFTNATWNINTSVEELNVKQYRLNLDFRHRVIGEFCRDYSAYIHLR